MSERLLAHGEGEGMPEGASGEIMTRRQLLELRRELAGLLASLIGQNIDITDVVPKDARQDVANLLEPLGPPITMEDQMLAALSLNQSAKELHGCIRKARRRIAALEAQRIKTADHSLGERVADWIADIMTNRDGDALKEIPVRSRG